MNPFLQAGSKCSVPLAQIPVVPYDKFYTHVLAAFESEAIHCVQYLVTKYIDRYVFVIVLANDATGEFQLLSHEHFGNQPPEILALSELLPAMNKFEREMAEAEGIQFQNHPFMKPLRFPFNRFNQQSTRADYPYYTIQGDEIHEVGVGPIHAGVIEPGHFRFICNGEKVYHLEIVLGYQHRGIEQLMLDTQNPVRRFVLAESISGDSSIAHALAFAHIIESANHFESSNQLAIERTIALELERIAMHLADTGNICVGLAFQLGQVVCEALRTLAINTTQFWCGNRFGKGLIRAGGSYYYLDAKVATEITQKLNTIEQRYTELVARMFSLPSVLDRIENNGALTLNQILRIGAVGMTARMAGLPRDIRSTHPFEGYKLAPFQTLTQSTGDVFARINLRAQETIQSIAYIRKLLHKLSVGTTNKPNNEFTTKPNTLSVSMVEGWRGEISHLQITGPMGEVVKYKIKDPSFHNWKALALSVRELEISDFPINNKSYNLSYCGFDL